MRRASRAVAAVALLLAACAASTPTVDRLTVSNPTAYDLGVDVSDQGREGWLPVGIVEAGSEDTTRDVADQGEVWVFRFRHWGEPVEELELSREELEERGWQVEVPIEVGERLEGLGRPPSG